MIRNLFISSILSAAGAAKLVAVDMPLWSIYVLIAALVVIIILVSYITIKNNKDR